MKLLLFIARNKSNNVTVNDIEDNKILKDPRMGSDSPSVERRIRDTITSIRKKFKLSRENEFFVVSNTEFGINCSVEFL